jgi:hypothetical protein
MLESKKSNAGSHVLTILFLIFLTLKLANVGLVATWSWWWVTSPLWVPVTIVLAISALIIIVQFIIDSIKHITSQINK